MSTARIEPCPCGLRLMRDIDSVGVRGFCEVHGMFVQKQSDGRVVAQREPFPCDVFDPTYWRGSRRSADQRPLPAPRENIFQHSDFGRLQIPRM